jgi:hypothetical protein
MNENAENCKNEVALRRFAAVSFIEQKLREGFGIVEALRLATFGVHPEVCHSSNGVFYFTHPA